MSKPEPVDKGTEFTIIPEVEQQRGSDEGCEPMTPVDEAMEAEDWLIGLVGSHPVSKSSSLLR